jgi:serine/threonine protein kinase
VETITAMTRESRVVGRYELLQEIGFGGSATVYLARQTELGRLVALKELSALSAADPTAARRFVRESRLAGSLNHPNIVTVHDFFEDRATPFIAMEYLERGSLRPLMGHLAMPVVAGVLEGMLAGLAHAQERSIVHRDLKPENVMVTTDGHVKIADFGIAKAVGDTQIATILTVEGTTIGTPTYMAPEQALGEDVGPWTDLYALGVMAFELIARRPPFDAAGSPSAVLMRHLNDPPPELSSVEPSVDPALSDWVGRLLVKDPGDRVRSARAAWLELEEIVLAQLGPRWRRASLLPEPAAAALVTPETIPLPDRGRESGWDFTTAAPRSVAGPPTDPVPPRPRRDGRSARRVSRSLLFLIGLLVAAAAALAGMSGNGSGGSGAAPARPAAATTATPAAAPTVTPSPAPPVATATPSATAPGAPAPAAATPRADTGDERSDDPSDDEGEVGEP